MNSFLCIEHVIEQDVPFSSQIRALSGPGTEAGEANSSESEKVDSQKSRRGFFGRKDSSEGKKKEKKKNDKKGSGDANQSKDLHENDEDSKKGRNEKKEAEVSSHGGFQRLAYEIFSKRVPELQEFRQIYVESGIPLIYEAYLSTGFLVSLIAALSAFGLSLVFELKLVLRPSIPIALVASFVLLGIVFAVSLVSWLYYPVLRRRSYRAKLEGQLAYSFGILGVLAAAGMNLERLFERIAYSDSNPVLADLAKRFLRNIRLFGMDTETALAEVAEHSPSQAFARMLDSIAVAYKTTGSIHDLVMFESSRLLQEKRDKLRRTIGSLAVMAEIYITLVVVGPIIFIIMLAIFTLLPAGGLPNPVSFINLVVFVGIPVLSVMFVLMLDSVVSKT